MKNYELDVEKALLLVIDIQEKLVTAMAYGDQVIAKTRIMMETAAHLGMPMVVTEQYPKGLGATVADLEPWLEHAETFEKMTFSGFTEEVVDGLRVKGRQQIMVMGMETHVCVFQTVRSLLTHGYEVFVLEDGVCSRGKGNHKNGVALMREMGAVITTTEAAFFDLLKAAGTASFRHLRGLIK